MKWLSTLLILLSLVSLESADKKAELMNQKPSAGGGGGGAITYIASTGGYVGDNGGTTTAIDTTGANLVVICEEYFGTSTLSDSVSSPSFTVVTNMTDGTRKLRIVYVAAPTTSASYTVTSSGTGIYSSLQVMAFAGANASPFEHLAGDIQGSATSITPGSITPGQNGSLLVSAVQNSAGYIDSISGGYSTNSMLGPIGAAAYLIQGTAGAANPTWYVSGVSALLSAHASFKP